MSDTRKKNYQWGITTNRDGITTPIEDAHLATLMDIRDELQTLNGLLGCPNCIDIPNILRAIQENTRKPKRKRAAK